MPGPCEPKSCYLVFNERARNHEENMKKADKKAVPKTVEEYLARIPEPQRSTLQKVRAVIQSVLPAEATEIISYRIPCVKYKGMLVGYAAFADHCSLFGMSSTLLGPFQEELKKYSTSKGTIRFAVDKPLPATLITKLVKHAVAQKDARKKG
jgi:uncharacterized protein YdhG (YjbR/CyaY superfamily)